MRPAICSAADRRRLIQRCLPESTDVNQPTRIYAGEGAEPAADESQMDVDGETGSATSITVHMGLADASAKDAGLAPVTFERFQSRRLGACDHPSPG